MGEESIGVNLVKRMGENCVKSMGVKRWVKKVWVNFVKVWMKTLQKVRVKRIGEKVWVKTLQKVRVKILYKLWIKKDGCKKYR